MQLIALANKPELLQRHKDAYLAEVQKKIEPLMENGEPNFSCAKAKRKYSRWNTPNAKNKTKEYFSLYEAYVKDDENNLLTAIPEILFSFAQKEKKFRDIKVSKALWNYWKELISHIFNYSNFASNDKKPDEWGAGKFIEELDVHACCYCNADIVYSKEFVVENGTEVIRYKSALDHFYPKDKYPYLALSLYNLVPVCDRCNSKFKQSIGVEEGALLNPHEKSLADFFSFLYAISSVKDACHFPPCGKVRCWYDFTTPIGEDSQAINSLKKFHVEEVYNELYDFVVKDIMAKRCLLTTGYGRWLNSKLHFLGVSPVASQLAMKYGDKKFLANILEESFRKDWKQRLFDFSFNPEDINRRPFSKLIIDLAGDL